MGMIAFRTAAAEFGRVRLIDRLGLTSRDFTDCPVTAALARRTSAWRSCTKASLRIAISCAGSADSAIRT